MLEWEDFNVGEMDLVWLNWNAKLIHKRPAMCEADVEKQCILITISAAIYWEEFSVVDLPLCSFIKKEGKSTSLHILKKMKVRPDDFHSIF